jgi:hypothetical protein
LIDARCNAASTCSESTRTDQRHRGDIAKNARVCWQHLVPGIDAKYKVTAKSERGDNGDEGDAEYYQRHRRQQDG